MLSESLLDENEEEAGPPGKKTLDDELHTLMTRYKLKV